MATETNTTGATAGMMDWLEERRERFVAMADAIWARPELALAELYACGLQADVLAAGCQVRSWRSGARGRP